MAEETGEPPQMWGKGIVGFGSYRMTYADGREADWMALGFSPRKQNLVLYLMDGFAEYEQLLTRLGKHSTGKACLYLKRLSDVDLDVLRELVARSTPPVLVNRRPCRARRRRSRRRPVRPARCRAAPSSGGRRARRRR